MIELEWLPAVEDWSARLAQARSSDSPDWPALRALAASSVDFLQTDRLDRVLGKTFAGAPPEGLAAPVVRLAVTGSATLSHLAHALRIAAARRNMWAEVHVGEYGQYHQELEDPDSALWQFSPTALLIALDARHLFARQLNSAEEAADHVAQLLDRCEALWTKARARGLHVIHQTAMPVLPQLAGNNEHRIGWSAAGTLAVYNEALRARADAAGVDLLDLAPAIAADGLKLWHDPALWHRAKQEVTIRAAPAYGDLVMRLIAARAGRSAKCLVLDLDNTLWGGVIGDDGLAGIVLGQGNAAGEAHLALQAFARDLTRRGVILAVCSKNDEANALEPFDQHPDMLLRRSDIACFVANWQDKATNLRHIAAELNIGTDALLFVDDNPAERALIRRELPEVMVPELGDDPSLYVDRIAASGWLEATALTDDDLVRASQYQANAQRTAARADVTDIDAYLRSLAMEMRWRAFDRIGLSRVAQLINKSNQFNLTTRRYNEAEIEAMIGDPAVISLQLRLIDSFGDNGMISVLIARQTEASTAEIDTWLMSCRVLGRGAEAAALNLLAQQAKARGVERLIGRYLPSAKNSMVAAHYEKLGFVLLEQGDDGSSVWQLDLTQFAPLPCHIECTEG